ncbi:MAG: hypothetical protein M1503_08290 [Thaumarchaeota archaeon]|nr:hypothetical protein [Nitrososphaerota archaeon]MCL5318240.1 hypothetical protein [Nitrososphaerota archaeon]
MPDRCKICGERVETNHEAHLRRVHGIYDIKLAVDQYFERTSSSTKPYRLKETKLQH